MSLGKLTFFTIMGRTLLLKRLRIAVSSLSLCALSMCTFIFLTKFKVRQCVMSEGALCEPLSY